MLKTLFTNPKKCTGCRVCELACSLYHYSENNPSRALLKIAKTGESSLDIPVVCRHCRKAPCMEACSEDAIVRDPRTGAVNILQEKCVGCRDCISACPWHIIVVDSKTGEVRKCDLCDGDPACVRTCPTKAITYDRSDVAPKILIRKSVFSSLISGKVNKSFIFIFNFTPPVSL